MHQRQEEGEEGEDEVRGLKMEEVLRRARGEKVGVLFHVYIFRGENMRIRIL